MSVRARAPVGSPLVTSAADSPAVPASPGAPFDPASWGVLDRRAVDTVRVLAADSVQKVGNGHPGTAMSLAPVAYLLFQRYLRHDPADPDWLGRDRFVLSCGHSSLTLYIQLFLSGYGLELSDLQSFRTWGSLTPGHPERHHTRGVETTTGPLGQGLSTAVGMAMGARYERGLLDPDAAAGTSPFDHTVYVIASDGDLEEGITSEASSLAGTQKLDNLVVIWDDNKISIEDDTAIAFSEDTLARYAAYGWHTDSVDLLPDGDVDVAGLAARTRPRPRRSPTARRSSGCTPSSAGRRRTCATPSRPTAPRSVPTRWPPPRSCSASTRRSPSRSATTCSRTPAR